MPVRSRPLAFYAPLLLGLAALGVYVATVAPGLTWAHHGADGGDLVTAAYTGGVPHPSGYPLYLLLGRCFGQLPVRNVAFRFNLMSAVSAALAITVFTAWARKVLGRVFPDSTYGAVTIASGAGGALLAFSRLFWSQALIAEVYALNALMAAACLWWLQRWEDAPQSRRPAISLLLGLTGGLAAGNHLTILLLAPPMFYVLLSDARRPGAREWAGILAGLGMGLLVYLLIPARAAAGPYVNWGNADRWDRFWWLVSGALYQHYAFAIPLQHLPLRIASWAGELVRQFGPWGVALGLLGIWTLSARRRVLGLSVGIFILYSLYAIGYNTADSFVYLIPSYVVWALWSGLGILYLPRWVRESWPDKHARWWLALAIACLMPLVSLGWNWQAMDLSDDTQAMDYVRETLPGLPSGAILISASDAHTFSLWYAQQVERLRPDVLVIDRDLLPYDWYGENLFPRYPGVDLPAGDVAGPDWLSQLVENNLASRAVFLADADERLMARYQAVPRGALHELSGR